MANNGKKRKSSPLSTYTRLSPNRSAPRNKKIRRLTPHCVAGNLSVQTTLGLANFINSTGANRASTNYAIGSDGKIGLGVEETNRAWTSSNSANDNEAITFEIANNGGGPSWPMSDAALNAWLTLAVDIAQFYGFKKVAYHGSKDKLGTNDEMIITLHRWFANKACPGNYFVTRIPQMVKEINNRLAGGKTNVFKNGVLTTPSGGTTTTPPATTPPVTPPPSSSPPATGFMQYLIKITGTAVNIRSGPGVDNKIVKTLRNDPNSYTIVEEKKGLLNNTTKEIGNWGRLKSGIGWIALKYTKKV